ncbi:MAG: hypothetical protein RSC16_07780 [Enterococcus sp.]|uniref:hypothetical protein n=1 Tax=Enterococcus sp. TaxID=35783 RepID=UPI002FCC2710
MPLIALLIDLLAFGSYVFQLHNGHSVIYLLGLIIQIIITVLLLIILVGYHGKKYSRFKSEGYSYLSIRYAIIVFSLILNAIMVFFYVLNYLGINDVVFANF